MGRGRKFEESIFISSRKRKGDHEDTFTSAGEGTDFQTTCPVYGKRKIVSVARFIRAGEERILQ